MKGPLIALCFSFLVLPCSAAMETDSSLPSAKILKQWDCFSGPFESYDKWLQMIGKGEASNQKRLHKFKQLFPKESFENYQKQLDCQVFNYLVDDVLVRGYSVAPKAKPNEILPVLLYNRGGNGLYGSLNFGYLMRNLFPLAEEGFLMLASDYRGGTHWPKSKQKATDKLSNDVNDEFGGADVLDVLALISVAEKMPQADLQRVGILGSSRGGMQSYLAVKQQPIFKSMATIAAPTDLLLALAQRPEMEKVLKARIPNYEHDKEGQLNARSAIAWMEQFPAIPILLVHGSEDTRVSVEHSLRMAEKLESLQREHKLVVYPGDDHGLTRNRQALVKELADWFTRTL
ncbi:prolyl oligopeptidase family serine peptidase [Aliiglaciecola sp. CAU 1673]|uniref:alpha/beta hydrolase family protein n=1 Tax=Aliiglaciecola sp. CAU 1673 TaxID=3032595 RepID=UPI0023DBE27D|nr:prolyl oligopeptidase family serine peptidase [Aliiglaciecola sp. CAU 1673]MDF2180075.1 prolyl oligopeptidase family serine peptidase [Aliiglaciecola sp. CAU 1673]